jgi:GcrA cell cycle regulator
MLPGAMIPGEFHSALDTLGLAQQRVAQLFGVGPRAVRRWRDGERRVPCGVGIVFRLLAAGAVTIDQVERAAVARANGGLEPTNGNGGLPVEERDLEMPSDAVVSAPLPEVTEPPAIVAPLPETPAFPDLEPTLEATDLAERLGGTVVPPNVAQCAESVTTAEKVAALTSRSCRWPIGDPASPEFCFCGEATMTPPYCEHHHGVAYLAPPVRLVRRRDRASARIAWVG